MSKSLADTFASMFGDDDEHTCRICGGTENLKNLPTSGGYICDECAAEVAAETERKNAAAKAERDRMDWIAETDN